MSKHAHLAADSTHAAEDAAREPVASPEAHAQASDDENKRESVKPPEAIVPKEPKLPEHGPIATHATPAAATVPVELPASDPLNENDLKAAEVALAQYIGGQISPELSSGLVLNLSECTEKGAGFKLSFTGPHVIGNREELGHAVEQALRGLDVLKLFLGLPEAKIHHTKPGEKPDTVEVHVNGFTVEQYKKAVRDLGGLIPQTTEQAVMASAAEAMPTIQTPVAAHETLETTPQVQR